MQQLSHRGDIVCVSWDDRPFSLEFAPGDRQMPVYWGKQEISQVGTGVDLAATLEAAEAYARSTGCFIQEATQARGQELNKITVLAELFAPEANYRAAGVRFRMYQSHSLAGNEIGEFRLSEIDGQLLVMDGPNDSVVTLAQEHSRALHAKLLDALECWGARDLAPAFHPGPRSRLSELAVGRAL